MAAPARPAKPPEPCPQDPLAFFADLHPPASDFRRDVLEGLAATPKRIPPKYFYDKRGSALFDAITRTRDYYVTRTELALLDAVAPEIAARAGPGAVVIEPGSGSSLKIRKLIDALDRPAAYIGLDISREHLIAACTDLASDHRDLLIGAICADFTAPLRLDDHPVPDGRRIVFFPGSTIGNFEPAAAQNVLRRLGDWLRPGDALLVGVDREKDSAILETAYDDSEGVTAAFNRNLITRIVRELGSDLGPGDFRHRARWNARDSRIEMHLEAVRDLDFHVAGQKFSMRAGETIHTENSHKFTPETFETLARGAGLVPTARWSDPSEFFTLYWLEWAGEA